MRLLAVAVLSVSLTGCFNFDAAYARYCQLNKCPDGGTGGAGGSGGGAVGGGGGSAGGGTGGGSVGGGTGGGTGGGSAGGGAGGGTGGGSAGGAGGGTGGDAGMDGGIDAGPVNTCDAGLCYVRNYDLPKKFMYTISAAGPNAVYAGGQAGTVVRFDGTTFTPATTPQMTNEIWSVSGSSPTNAWAVGTGGKTNRWDGTSWVPQVSPTFRAFYGVYAFPDNTALGVTTYGEVLKWTGSAWVVVTALAGQDTLNDVHGCTPEEAWVVGYDPGTIFYFNADAGTLLPEYPGAANVSIEAVYCHPTAGVWAVGAGTTVLHRDGAGMWQPYPVPGLTSFLHGVWVSPAGEPWIAGSARTLARLTPEDGGYVSYNVPPYDLSNITDISGTGEQLWVIGNYALPLDGGTMVQYNIGPK